MRRTRTVRTALLLVMAAAGTAVAQDVVLSGTVTDTTGLVLPGVTVEVLSAAGAGPLRTASTDVVGTFALTALEPGAYDVTFTLPGFREVVRTGVEIRAGGWCCGSCGGAPAVWRRWAAASKARQSTFLYNSQTKQ